MAGLLGLAILVYGIHRVSQLPSFSWSSLILPAIGLFFLAVGVWGARELPAARELDREGVQIIDCDFHALPRGEMCGGEVDARLESVLAGLQAQGIENGVLDIPG